MDRRLPAFTLALLGVGLLVHPIYLSLPAGQQIHPTFQEVDETVCGSTIAYEDLPPRARHSFDVTSLGDLPRFNDTLYTGQHTETVEAFREHDCVSRDGNHFEVDLVHRDGAIPDPATLVGPCLFGAGGLALLGSALIWRAE